MGSTVRTFYLFCLTFSTVAQAFSPPSLVWKIESRDFRGQTQAILLTGFGPFGTIANNPSGRIVDSLARALKKYCGNELSFTSEILPVKNGIIETKALETYLRVLSIGVDAEARAIRVETKARNYFWDPETETGGPIDPKQSSDFYLAGGPLPSNIEETAAGFLVELGQEGTAGTYVCNDTFYRICQRSGGGYFLHIPNTPPKKDAQLTEALSEVACRILTQKTGD